MIKRAELGRPRAALDETPATTRGLNIVEDALLTKLKRNERAAGDPAFKAALSRARRCDVDYPIDAALVDRLKQLSDEDVARIPELRFAPWVRLIPFSRLSARASRGRENTFGACFCVCARV